MARSGRASPRAGSPQTTRTRRPFSTPLACCPRTGPCGSADRGADALTAAGWTGPLNYTNDTGQIAAIMRSWEDRFGARVVGVGFADLYVSVAAPPATLGEALRVAAEHFAFCPDNIWQGPGTLTGYASRLAGTRAWEFWWD
jgi:hypothetical protein